MFFPLLQFVYFGAKKHPCAGCSQNIQVHSRQAQERIKKEFETDTYGSEDKPKFETANADCTEAQNQRIK